MEFQNAIIDGHLNNKLTIHCETINKLKNINKKNMERFILSSDPAGKSFIFKPTFTAIEVEQEVWIQKELLSLIPTIKTPNVLDYKINLQDEIFWMILEDEGQLSHDYNENILVSAAEAMVKWHSLNVDLLTEPRESFVPYVDEVVTSLLDKEFVFSSFMTKLGIDQHKISWFYSKLRSLNNLFPTEIVLCHGDYHILNLAKKNEALIVLDWEFFQCNSVYFDLFMLLDRAAVYYRIKPTAEIRLRTLDAYINERLQTNWIAPSDFQYNYHLFACMYSVFTLEWLFNDLDSGRFEAELLLQEKAELESIITDCLDFCINT